MGDGCESGTNSRARGLPQVVGGASIYLCSPGLPKFIGQLSQYHHLQFVYLFIDKEPEVQR